MSRPAAREDRLARARELGIDTCGRIAQFWGFTRTMGRAFGLLYLSPVPLSQAELQRRLDISAGNASMTLAALGRWGVVHRVWIRGERREHYQAETDFWKMIASVLDQRERREITAAVGIVEEARGHARAAASTRGRDKAEAEFVRERLDRLADVCGLGQTMLDMLLGQLKLDVGRFRDVLAGGAAAALVAGTGLVRSDADANLATGQSGGERSASPAARSRRRVKTRTRASRGRATSGAGQRGGSG